MRVVDTHCHLTSGKLGEDAEAAWERAQAAGVDRAVVVGTNRRGWHEVLEFVSERDGLYAAIGVHPCETHKVNPGDWQDLESLVQEEAVVAVGESGLDFYWDDAPPAVQRDFLDRHVGLALRLDLPLVLHLRDAYSAAAEALLETSARGLRAVVHCFGGEPDDIHPFVDWGWPISFAGILTYRKALNVQEAARRVPLEQCLVETDAPYLTPRGGPSGINEPAFVVRTLKKLAQLKEIDLETAARVTTANAERVFGLEPSRSGET